MIVLALFFLFIIILLLSIIPLIKSILEEYSLTIPSFAKQQKAQEMDAVQKLMNDNLEKRNLELNQYFEYKDNLLSSNRSSEEMLNSLKIYLQSILQLLKSE